MRNVLVAALLTTCVNCGTEPEVSTLVQAIDPSGDLPPQCLSGGSYYNRNVSIVGLLHLAIWNNLPCNEVVTAAAIGLYESGGGLICRRMVNPSPYTIDRGLWQLNNHWHPEVDDETAYSPYGNASAMARIFRSRGWTEWASFNNEGYKVHLENVRRVFAGGPFYGRCD